MGVDICAICAGAVVGISWMYWWSIVYHLVVDLSVLVLGIVVVAVDNKWLVVLDLDVADSLAFFVYCL